VTKTSRLLEEFPTVNVEKQEYVSDWSIERDTLDEIDTISSIICMDYMGISMHDDNRISMRTCDVYVRKFDKEDDKEAFKKLWGYGRGGWDRFGFEQLYNDLGQPVVITFNEKTNTLDVLAKTYEGYRTIATITKVIHLSSGSRRNAILVDADELKRLIDVYDRYEKRVKSLESVFHMYDMEGEKDAFRAIARFALGFTPNEDDGDTLMTFADDLRSFADYIEGLASDMDDYHYDETREDDEDDEYDDEDDEAIAE
jgi:hypothetical protein